MKNKKQNGYAILITVVVISIILLIATGLSNSTYKQLVLSSSAKDSQTAFYQADTASECALYADYKMDILTPKIEEDGTEVEASSDFTCGRQYMTISKEDVNGDMVYSFEPDGNDMNKPCFRIVITKKTESLQTVIEASGYNICNRSNLRAVERTIQVTY